MRTVSYPFAAIVGQEQMKLALLLAAIDWRLGVLLRGDKGAGKTTTARSLGALLPAPAPFLNLPIGITEDRLLGGLHLESALRGAPELKHGLLSEAHRGILYIDEVNLLAAHLGDAILDAAASGMHVIEREGFSASHPAEFVLLGSMNPEEGLLRPQLQDRFALSVDIAAPLDQAERQMIVERRLAFDRNPSAFTEEWSIEQEELRSRISRGRELLSSVVPPGEILAQISAAACAAGVRSLRADLSAVRASMACAAWMGEASVAPHHVEAVLPLVLNHRARSGGQPPPSSSQTAQPEQENQNGESQRAIERIFAPRQAVAPVLQIAVDSTVHRGASQKALEEKKGAVTGTRLAESPRELDILATVHHAIAATGSPQPRISDLHEKVRVPRSGVRYLFLIDSSGSHAMQEKMARVKGAVLDLLHRGFRRNDEVAMIVFRGTDAKVLLEPSQILDDARTALEYLPTGGRTPLAHALELAKAYLTSSTVMIVLTDGRANVALRGGDPWIEAKEIASRLRTRSLVIDTAPPEDPFHRAAELGEVLGARSIALADLPALEIFSLEATL
ncbi:ATP-binding protein [Silvibacterium dinghuense]|uniref:VWA domain-containing protein n=1 Tax=Silvibacterium dinghuense TaxID=1560006 RepID=A0A4Q1SJ53_9BACT|nr:ATP-binding protein [Silvibacterium dinghuense]RXS97664.1 VWA domain-containing protein [Silvibacterium dinghuense]GGH00941.1 magnesium chelatase subunit ChlI [Silvibacterium dinghuense]